MKTIQHSL